MLKSVLSIQSSVSFGAVGNTMASAVMAALGHHLARVDTVQLVAHPGHGYRAGGTITPEDFDNLLAHIFTLGFDHSINAIMTGYMAGSQQVDSVANILGKIVHDDKKIDVVIDPAIGDHGRLYVDDDIAKGIVDKLVPFASVITPNAFEFSHLAGHEMKNLDEIHDAGHALMAKYPRLRGIAVTGWHNHETGRITDCWIDGDDMITYDALTDVSHETNNGGMSGGGDLFAAMLMGTRLSGLDWRHAFEKIAPLSRQIINSAQQTGAIDIDLSIVRDVLSGGRG